MFSFKTSLQDGLKCHLPWQMIGSLSAVDHPDAGSTIQSVDTAKNGIASDAPRQCSLIRSDISLMHMVIGVTCATIQRIAEPPHDCI